MKTFLQSSTLFAGSKGVEISEKSMQQDGTFVPSLTHSANREKVIR